MSEMVDRWVKGTESYAHGIVGQDCYARKFAEGGFAIQLVSAGTFVRIHSVRDEDVMFCVVRDDMQLGSDELLCKKSDVIYVPENLWGPLFTLAKSERLSLVEDRKTAESMGNICVGHAVQVVRPDGTQICTANVTFRNAIGKLGPGVFFGLQVIASKENVEDVIKNVSLMEPGSKGFPRGCDLVVRIDVLRPCGSNYSKDKAQYAWIREIQKDPVKQFDAKNDMGNSNFKSATAFSFKDKISSTLKKSHQIPFSNSEQNVVASSLKKMTGSDNSLMIGEEVIYMDGNTPEKGIVRWIGKVKNVLKVGVEFQNPIINEMGTFDGIDFLKTKYKHAIILSPAVLTRLSEYNTSHAKEKIYQKIITNNNNNNNNCNKSSNINYNICNNNNTNNYNENNNKLNSSSFCCTNKHFSEEKFKILKMISNSRQCLKHMDRKFDSEEDYFGKTDEFFPGHHSCKNEWCKSEQGSEFQGHVNSKSFDCPSSLEKRTDCRKHFASLDCEPGHHKDRGRQDAAPDAFLAQSWCDHEDPDKHVPPCRSNEGRLLNRDHSELWDFHSSKPSYDEGNSVRQYDFPKPRICSADAVHELTKGSVVELTHEGEPRYGVIRWVGTLPDERDEYQTVFMAGIEMEEERDGFTDGTYNNRRYFECNPRKALFVPLAKCRKDSRFSDESKRHDAVINYGQIDCPAVEGTVPPINRKDDIESICGKNRGIQGHHNSCYLDATLFSMFAFTSVFDSLLYRPPTRFDIPQYAEVQRVLRDEIVNPLRKNLYVRADRVMKLRTLLDKLSSVSGLTSEEKDPEEFLNSLLAQILKAEPFLKLISGQEAFHHQLFVEKDDRLTFPSVQQLFEQSFVTSDIKLKQIPSCLIIQMPRFGKSFKMYSRILPPQLLDVTDIIENSPRQCTVCGKLAEYECKDCFGQPGISGGLEGISYCRKCLETAHSHHCRTRHDFRSLTVPEEFFELREHCVIPRLYLELFAVVCIETSHYVAFVKCGSGSDAPWCFFDSMADRKGEQNGYNIPEMVPCPELPYWLSEEGTKMMQEMGEDLQLPEHAKRLFSDAYMCMYQSPDLMMYR